MEKLNPFELLKCLAETEEETILRRGRTERDYTSKGKPFEDWICKQIKAHSKEVTINARGNWLSFIPHKDYIKAKKKWAKILSSMSDIGVMWNAEVQIIIEAGYRTQFYYNNDKEPPCKCVGWEKTHVNLPNYDVERFLKIHEKFPKIQYWIFIGNKNNIFAIVKLEEWLKHSFKDYNTAFKLLGDNPEQSVICLKQTPHYESLEEWTSKASGIPT